MYRIWNALFTLNPALKAHSCTAFLTAEGIQKRLLNLEADQYLLVCQPQSWVSNQDCKEWLFKNKPCSIYLTVDSDYWKVDTKSKAETYLVYLFKKEFKGEPKIYWLAPPRDENGLLLYPEQTKTKIRKSFKFRLGNSKTKHT